MQLYRLLAVVALILWCAPASGAQGENDNDDYTIQDITVQAPGATDITQHIVEKETLASGRFTNVGEALIETPGVSAIRRGAGAAEPVIRGLGWERVATQVNGLPLHGACPSRMDPPITYVHANAAEEITVVKGAASVTRGPAGTGGRILIDTDYERDPQEPSVFNGWLKIGGETDRNGLSGEIGGQGGNRWLDIKAVVEGLAYSDYASGDGIEVPADQRQAGGTLSLGLRPTENHRWSNFVNYVREDGVAFPSLPMDLDESDFWLYTTGYRIRPTNGTIEEVKMSAGVQQIDHLMSNREKPNRGMVEAQTPSDSDSYSGSAIVTFRMSPAVSLKAGGDYYQVNRDAVRTRRLVMTGQVFEDHIWPDVTQTDWGGFAEVQARLWASFDLRLGARVDQVSSRADAVDASSLMMQTVREQYVRFYGPSAADVNKDETLGSGNIVLTWQPEPWIESFVSAGIATRAAGVTERYFAFAAAPGGYLVGNPTLDPEQKFALEWGMGLNRRWGEADLTLFHNWVTDYILQTQIDRIDVDGDGSTDLVRGFRNVDARLYGLELRLQLRVGDHWSIPLSASYVRGKNTTDDKDLAEIPPLEGSAAVRAGYGDRNPWWVQVGGRFVDKQRKIDPDFPEDETSGFAVFHLRGGVFFVAGITFEIGVENLFDTDYNEHLTREAYFTQGGLIAGDEVPAPGRTVYGSVRWDF